MKKAQRIELLREIRHSLNRYLSILFIVALGVAFYLGILSSEPDMRTSADSYFDEAKLMDVRVVGTLGLTEEDVDAVKALDGVASAEGAYSIDVLNAKNDYEYVVQVISACRSVNQMTVVEGRMPTAPDECFMDSLFLKNAGYQIGDEVTLSSGTEDPLSDSLARDAFTIVGQGSYAQYLTWRRGSSSIGKGSLDAFMVVPDEAFTMDAYTSIYMSVAGTDAYECYGEEYKDAVREVMDRVEAIQDERAAIRYASVQDEANEKLADANGQIKEAEDELADAKSQLADAEKEWKDGERKLAKKEKEWKDGKKQWRKGREQLKDARSQLADEERRLSKAKNQWDAANKQLARNEEKWTDGSSQYKKGLAQYNQGKRQYEKGLADYRTELASYQRALPQKEVLSTQPGYAVSLSYYQTLVAKKERGETLTSDDEDSLLLLGRIIPEIQKATASLGLANPPDSILSNVTSSFYSTWDSALRDANQKLGVSKKQLDATNKKLRATKRELDSGERQLAIGKKELKNNREKLSDGERQLKDAKATLVKKKKDLAKGKNELKDGLAKIKDAKKELKDGRTELDDANKEYTDSKAEADEQLADAKADVQDGEEALRDLEEPEWFVLNRDSIQNYVEYDMDADRIGAIGRVFPVLFFLVAALVSLTTMTRMVEENRVQIGTMKALGYGKFSISSKYVLYALTASVLGGILGVLVGSFYLPMFLMNAYGIMYENLTPHFSTRIHTNLALLSLLFATGCTVLAALAASYRTLSSTAASLMRPTPPKHGKRVFLEHFPWLWQHLHFTMKSTIRNLVRYKKRFLMTVFGLGGCMALLIVGFGLRDSISKIAVNQFLTLWLYDADLSLDTEYLTDQDALASSILEMDGVEDAMYAAQKTVDFMADKRDSGREGVLFVPKDAASFDQFIVLRDRRSHETYHLTDDGAVVTEKLATLLDLRVGDSLTMKEGDAEYYEVTITAITENYIDHYVYLSPNLYEEIYREPPEYNNLMLEGDVEDLPEELLQMEPVSSVLMVTELESDVDDMMQSLDDVIWVLIVSAGLLAFVVLFNLNNINITERKRELATIKVLGFFNLELAGYVYRENLILMLFGIVVGVVMGVPLHQYIIRTCEIDSMMFHRDVSPASFALSAALTVVFSLLVNAGMFFNFKKIDMVESLKSVE